MAAEHWFRWHHGCVTDPKFRVIASRCVTNVTVGHVVAVWAAMMENASQASPRGTLSGWDDEDVAAGFGFTVEQVSDIRSAMQGKVLDGETLAAWEKRQPKREDSSSDRTKRWRETKRDGSDATKRSVTQGDAAKRDVTLETETETETEEKKIKNTERQAARFDDFWNSYPNKKGKTDARKAWGRKGLDGIADRIIADVKARVVNDQDWVRGYVPHGSTYVNAEGWEDAVRNAGVPEPSDRGRNSEPSDDFWRSVQ